MRKCLIAVLATSVALLATAGFASTADARSYAANAVNKVNKWAKYRYRSAFYIETQCYPAGYRRADCQVVVTKASSSCSVNVAVSGRYYKIRPYDSTC